MSKKWKISKKIKKNVEKCSKMENVKKKRIRKWKMSKNWKCLEIYEEKIEKNLISNFESQISKSLGKANI